MRPSVILSRDAQKRTIFVDIIDSVTRLPTDDHGIVTWLALPHYDFPPKATGAVLPRQKQRRHHLCRRPSRSVVAENVCETTGRHQPTPWVVVVAAEAAVIGNSSPQVAVIVDGIIGG